MRSSVYGIGINDADYRVVKQECINGKSRQTWMCPFYRKWKDMLKRCYSKRFHESRPTYKGCTVCEEWLTFSNFKSWMEKQDWEGKHLDKDLLIEDNKVYSPETCIFISPEVNTFIEWGTNKRSLPRGVCWCKDKNKYRAFGKGGNNKTIYLGQSNDFIECHLFWVEYKLKSTIEILSSGKYNQKEVAGLTVFKNRLEEALIDKTIFDG